MKKLFLLDGVAGTGKSDLLEYVRKTRHNINVINKYTTRNPRDNFDSEKSDLIFISDNEFNENNQRYSFLTYKYGDKQYGFWEEELYASVSKHENTFLIIRNNGLIKEIKSKYETKVIVVSVFIYSDRGLVEDRLKKDGYDDESIIFRIDRSKDIWNDYIEFDDFSDIVILNNSDINQFHQKINQLIKHYENYEKDDYLYINPIKSYQIIDPLVKYKDKIKKMLDGFPFEKNIFLMIKFRPENYALRRYIEDELEKNGYNCIIADDPKWNITHNVFNPIAVLYCCKYGIALFDKPEVVKEEKDVKDHKVYYNPNVAYELGIMHNQLKKCLILIHSTIESIPFDILKELRKTYTEDEEINKHFSDWLESIKNE